VPPPHPDCDPHPGADGLMGIIHTEGVTARAVGVPRADNPYWLGTAAHAAWWRGWERPGARPSGKQPRDLIAALIDLRAGGRAGGGGVAQGGGRD
jgi:hypothetical protein